MIDDICTLCKKEKGTLGHILGHCDVALGKTESSFNRIAWRHDKVLQTTREKALEHSKLIKTKGYQLMADLEKNRHDFLQTLRSFDSKLKPDIVLINESTKDIIIADSLQPAKPGLLVESSLVDDMLSSEIAAIDFLPKAQDPCGQRPSSPLSNSSEAAYFNPTPSARETVSSELPLSSVRVVACVSKTKSVVDEPSKKSKHFSHWPAHLLEGPFGPHKIVIPTFWIYDADEDT